ncbi:MAG: FG-GAP repeat domain-containing protein, partial [bacterium]
MRNTLSKRKRNILLTVLVGIVSLSTIITAFWLFSKPQAPYRPGEDIEGITANLARSLPKDYPRVTFGDVSKEAGIDFQHFSGRRSTQLPEDMGSGAAWCDYDNDGWLDLFVANEAGPLTMSENEVEASSAHSMLYHNNGDGTFQEAI